MLVFFALLLFMRNTQAILLVRGILFLIILISLMVSLFDLPAFSWLVATTLPALLLAVPVIFAPEIRRALERLGRAGNLLPGSRPRDKTQDVISSVVHAAERLSNRRHGALIILKRFDSLDEYIETGIPLGAEVTPELLLQIFYPNTPMHDGAVVIVGEGRDMLALARNVTAFFRNESCGKCVPCRIGTQKAVEMIDGKRPGDLAMMAELHETLVETSICGLGQAALNSVLSVIEKFPDALDSQE